MRAVQSCQFRQPTLRVLRDRSPTNVAVVAWQRLPIPNLGEQRGLLRPFRPPTFIPRDGICADACGANDQLTNAARPAGSPSGWPQAEVTIGPRANDPADTQWNTKPWS